MFLIFMLTNSSLTIFRDKGPSFVPHIIMHLFHIVLRDVGINISPCIAMVENLIVVLKDFAIIVLFKKTSNRKTPSQLHLHKYSLKLL